MRYFHLYKHNLATIELKIIWYQIILSLIGSKFSIFVNLFVYFDIFLWENNDFVNGTVKIQNIEILEGFV